MERYPNLIEAEASSARRQLREDFSAFFYIQTKVWLFSFFFLFIYPLRKEWERKFFFCFVRIKLEHATRQLCVQKRHIFLDLPKRDFSLFRPQPQLIKGPLPTILFCSGQQKFGTKEAAAVSGCTKIKGSAKIINGRWHLRTKGVVKT